MAVIDIPPVILQGEERRRFLDNVRAILRAGRCILFRPFQDVHGWSWNLDSLRGMCGADVAPRDWHGEWSILDVYLLWPHAMLPDAALRRTGFDTHPEGNAPIHRHGSLRDFLNDAEKPGACLNMMSVGLGSVSRPWFIE